MIKRTVEIAETSAVLSLENRLLRVRLPDSSVHTVPVCEIECLILANPAVSVSGALLSALAENGVSVVVSSANRMPSAMMLPLDGNYIQTERFHAQMQAHEPLKKRLWQAVVKEKIHSQGRLLKKVKNDDFGLFVFSSEVKSGDIENMEAQSASVYWKQLFDIPFLRNRDCADNNLLLNYGYAVLRAMTARAVCAAGLHPTAGINHHNRYNPFCLADDLMEPYRYIVDEAVYLMNSENRMIPELQQSMRRALISALQVEVQTASGSWKLSDLLLKNANAVVKSFTEGQCLLEY